MSVSANVISTQNPVFSGNPFIVRVTAGKVSGTSFHRVILDVTAGGKTFDFSSSVLEEGSAVDIDVSSAFRAVLESTERSAVNLTAPSLSWSAKAYDEYMKDGVVTTSDKVNITGGTCYYGAYSDFERMGALPTKFTRKPTTLAQIVCVDDIVVIPSSVSKSSEYPVSEEGELTLGGYSVYALASSKTTGRANFRFINGFGLIESVNVPRTYSKQVKSSSERYVVAKQETFTSFSHLVVRKKGNREIWQFSTDPLDEKWVSWYMHEFMMSEHIWVHVGTEWVPCHITPEDETTLYDETNGNMYSLSFNVELDYNGSPIL